MIYERRGENKFSLSVLIYRCFVIEDGVCWSELASDNPCIYCPIIDLISIQFSNQRRNIVTSCSLWNKFRRSLTISQNALLELVLDLVTVSCFLWELRFFLRLNNVFLTKNMFSCSCQMLSQNSSRKHVPVQWPTIFAYVSSSQSAHSDFAFVFSRPPRCSCDRSRSRRSPNLHDREHVSKTRFGNWQPVCSTYFSSSWKCF